MTRHHLGSLLFAFSGIVFSSLALFDRTRGKPMNSTYLIFGIVFLILALAHYRRGKATSMTRTDPRLPVTRTDETPPR